MHRINKLKMVDKTGLDETKVDETAVDEIAVDEPGPHRTSITTGGGLPPDYHNSERE